MRASESAEQIRQGRRRLERMRDRLIRPTPEVLVSSAGDLAAAASCLEKINLTANSPIWRDPLRRQIEPEVLALRSTILTIQQLLQNAGDFYGGLIRLFAPDQGSSNYTAEGVSAASPIAQNSVVLHG